MNYKIKIKEKNTGSYQRFSYSGEGKLSLKYTIVRIFLIMCYGDKETAEHDFKNILRDTKLKK